MGMFIIIETCYKNRKRIRGWKELMCKSLIVLWSQKDIIIDFLIEYN